jgi:hypothetical protein
VSHLPDVQSTRVKEVTGLAKEIEISVAELKEYGLPYDGYDGVEVIEDTITGVSRWSVQHRLIFKWIDGKYYKAHYSVGATEMQDEGPWDYVDKVRCTEVCKVVKPVEVWEPIE